MASKHISHVQPQTFQYRSKNSIVANTAGAESLKEILDDLERERLNHNDSKEKQLVQFAVHPLIAIEHFISKCNKQESSNYPRYELFDDSYVFERDGNPYRPINADLISIQKTHISNYTKLEQLVNDTVEYFRTEYTVMKLQDAYTSEWITEVMRILNDMDSNTLYPDDLKVICKLVPFYQASKKILDTVDDHDIKSVNDVTAGKTDFKVFKGLTLLYKAHPDTQCDRDSMGYFFKTETGHLLQVNVRNVALRSAIDTIIDLQDKVSLDISFKPRTIYNNNYTYLVSHNIQGVSA